MYLKPAILLSLLLVFSTFAEDRAKLDFFESKIRPVLIKHCYKCHSVESGKHKGGLLVDSREALIKGGDSGPSIVPGKPEESLMITAMSYEDLDLQMPEKKQLPKQIVDDFRKWVKDGAVDPRKSGGSVEKRAKMDDGRRQYWSFQPVKKDNFKHKSIDAFIDAKISAKGLKKADEAKPEDLIRRLFIDVTGLPPEPEDVIDFMGNPSDENYEKYVDKLLASSQYGAKWARFWLDMARYSETAGGGRSYPVPIAWRYRSYVIDSFNKDIPYNQFLKEQIAGDLLPAKSDEDKARQLIATAFMSIGAKPLDLQNKPQLVLDHVDEQLDTLGKVTMGMTIGCARCHDHEFDPITTKDYYRMSAIFQNTNAMTEGNISHLTVHPLPGTKKETVSEAVKHIEKFRGISTGIASLERRVQRGETAVQKEIDKKVKQFADLVKTNSTLPVAVGLSDYKKLKHGFIRIRGEAENKGAEVKRGGPVEFLAHLKPEDVPEDSSGRLQLADWIVHKDHPLTGRVYVNRIWSQLFGRGIVSSLDNFGTTGTKPTHPELLDFLATKFVKDGWSTKNLVRQILLSQTYKRSSVTSAKADSLDADNELLSYYPRRRLTAESIRDSILFVSGELDTTRVDGVIPYKNLQNSQKRSIYLPTLREEGRNSLLDVFDFPDASASTGVRNTTNLPSQALFLMNSPFVIQQAKAAAKRILSDGVEMSNREKLERASFLVYGRTLYEKEEELFLSQLESLDDQEKAWEMIFHSMFCSVDFRYLN